MHLPFKLCLFIVDAKIHQGILKGHTDAVWDLTVHRDRDLLATASSDGTCKLWNWRLSQQPLLSTLTVDAGQFMFQTLFV